MGLFDKLKQGLRKPAQLLKTDVRDLFKSKGQLVDEAFLEEWFEALVKTDMGVQAAHDIVAELRANFESRGVEGSEIVGQVKAKLKAVLG